MDFSSDKFNDDIVFALDIGTRTVIGIIGEKVDDKLVVRHCEIKEHESRAMLDGQVHDIGKVAQTVSVVKERLEKKSGLELKKVAIAAAGRVLQTKSVKVEMPLDSMVPIDKEIISSLEIEGVKKAQMELKPNNEEEVTDFYCVGYSVINYYLNGYIISNPLDHKGRLLSADILATFLPQTVIDSLYSVMDKVGLQVVSLTLEPIAAINVAIPEDLRLLNLALVDIGAGTSDIAITKDGAIVAYGMVPIAGDEITEKLVQNYLVDFNTAEKIKLSIGHQETIKFNDIIGIDYEKSSQELENSIKPAVDKLADEIASKILEYNEKSPNAVFCVGGGSLTNGLTQALAKRLDIPLQRVAVRDRDSIKEIEFSDEILHGPNIVTVVGIAKTAENQIGHDFIYVSFDNKSVRLFKVKDLKIADVLAFTGFDPKDLIGRTGKSVSFELNGVKKTIYGEFGSSAEIYLNGQLSSLDTHIKDEDSITIKPAVNGSDAEVSLKDFINGITIKRITLDAALMDISTKIIVNNQAVKSVEIPINNNDKIDIVEINTLKDLTEIIDYNCNEVEFYINGKIEKYDYVLKDGDKIDAIPKRNTENKFTVSDYLSDDSFADESDDKATESENDEYEHQASAIISGKDKTIEALYQSSNETKAETQKSDNSISVSSILHNTVSNESIEDNGEFYVYVNGEKIYMYGKTSYIFVDIFNYIDFDLSRPHGTLVLLINQHKARYTEKIGLGDEIVVEWK